MSTTNGPGGCNFASQCSDQNYCLEAPATLKCCRYPPACWTEGIGLMGRVEQAIDARTPLDAITRFSIHINRAGNVIGCMVLGDSVHFKAGDIIVEVDGMPAGDGATWAKWLTKSGDCTYLVLDSKTRKPSERIIARL